MTDAYSQALAELEGISRLMLEHAQCAEWERVEALERERNKWLTWEFPLEISHDRNLQIQRRLKRIIESDRRVMALARARQAELGDLLGRLSHGRKANRAYQDHALPEG